MINYLIIVLFLLSMFVAAHAQTVCDGTKLFIEKSCIGDNISPDEKALYDLVINYRTSKGLPTPKLSTALSMVANRHLIDIRVNLRQFTHSWSNCPYDIAQESSWTCITDAPQRLNSGYAGTGYETLYVTAETRTNINAALEKWKGSSLHNSILTNQGIFKDMTWDELGIAVEANYAALWFGSNKNSRVSGGTNQGLGVTYEELVAGLSGFVSIKPIASNHVATKWLGSSSDKKIKIEISGTKMDISEAKLAITAQLEADGTLNAQNLRVITTLLKNSFPNWSDRESWLQTVLKIIIADHSASRTVVLGKNLVELSYGAGNSIIVWIVPKSAIRAIEID